METITMSKFLESLQKDVKKCKRGLGYIIYDYDYRRQYDRNTFAIDKITDSDSPFYPEYETFANLKITPHANNFDFILDEIKKVFPNQYRLLYAKKNIYVVVGTVVILLKYEAVGDGKGWLLNTAKELTKPIAFSNFLEMLLNATENGNSVSYTIYNYDMCISRYDHFDGNIFSASGEYGDIYDDVVYLEIPKFNKYDFIFEEIRKVLLRIQYPYSISSRYNGINFSIGASSHISLSLRYYGEDGEQWIIFTKRKLGI